MGYNRSGKRRTDRLKAAKRYQERLAKKAAAASTSTTPPAVKEQSGS